MSVESKEAQEGTTNRERTAVCAGAEAADTKRPAAEEYVTLVEVLELTVPYEEFEETIRAAAGRLESEGVTELVSFNFYAEPGSKEAGAILVFSGAAGYLEHIEMISSWEEFGRFFATAKPLDVRVYGRLGAEAEAWISQFGDIVSTKFERHAAGFVR
jgi:hypothetical protein